MKGYLRQLASESAVYGLASIGSRFLSVLLVPLYTRLFAPEEFGTLSLVTTTVTLLSILVVLGLDNSAYRWFWDTEVTDERKRTMASWAWCQLTVSAVVGVILAAAAGPLSRLLSQPAEAAGLYRLLAFTLPLGAVVAVASGMLRLQRRPIAAASYGLGTAVVGAALTVLLAWWQEMGLTGVCLAQVLAQGCGAVVGAVLLRDWIAPRWFDRPRLLAMLRYALPLVPAAIAQWLLGFANRYTLEWTAGSREVGLFALASSIAMLLAIITAGFQQAWAPFALSIHQRPEARQVYGAVLALYVWLAGTAAAFLGVFAPEALAWFTTPGYAAATDAVGLLALAVAIGGCTTIAVIGPNIVKDNRPTALSVGYGAVLNVLLGVLMVPAWGIVGAAVAAVIAQLVATTYLFWRAQRVYPIPYRFGYALLVLAVVSTTVILATAIDGVIGRAALLLAPIALVPRGALRRLMELGAPRPG